MAFVSITHNAIEVRGRLNTGKGNSKKKIRIVLPLVTGVIAAGNKSRCVGLNGPFFDGAELDYVKVDLERQQLRVRLKDGSVHFWNGVPGRIKFEARGPVEDLIALLGGRVADAEEID